MELVSDRRAVLMDSNYLKLKNHLSNDHFGAFLLDLIEQVDCDVALTELEGTPSTCHGAAQRRAPDLALRLPQGSELFTKYPCGVDHTQF